MTDIPKITYYSLSGKPEEDKKLLEPMKYISESEWSNNHVSAKFTPVLNYWYKISPERLQQIEEITKIMFDASLLWDDIQDNSIFRGDVPVTHSIYGLCNTLNAANYAHLIALEKIGNLHPEAIKISIEELLEYHRGQGMDGYHKYNFICPTEEEYKIIALRKCGWLVKLTVRLMKLYSNYKGDLSSLINLISMYYQIYDDYSNLCHDINNINYCSDITEGKYSFPVIHAITKYPDDKQILNILKQRTTVTEMKRHCVKLLESFGSLKYTRDVLEELKNKIKIEVDCLGGNPLLLKSLSVFNSNIPKLHV